jgi:hypothetical protein
MAGIDGSRSFSLYARFPMPSTRFLVPELSVSCTSPLTGRKNGFTVILSYCNSTNCDDKQCNLHNLSSQIQNYAACHVSRRSCKLVRQRTTNRPLAPWSTRLAADNRCKPLVSGLLASGSPISVADNHSKFVISLPSRVIWQVLLFPFLPESHRVFVFIRPTHAIFIELFFRCWPFTSRCA